MNITSKFYTQYLHAKMDDLSALSDPHFELIECMLSATEENPDIYGEAFLDLLDLIGSGALDL